MAGSELVLRVICRQQIRSAAAAAVSNPNSPTCELLPLTFLDLPWLLFPSPNCTLFFYHYPHSTQLFLSTTLPNLTRALSVALSRFFPLAGRLCLSRLAIICRRDGDSVSLIIQECAPGLFPYCAAYTQPRPAELFKPLLPELPDKMVSEKGSEIPVLALKLSVFPGNGLCIGVAHHQVAADGRTMNNFLKTWAGLCRGSEEIISTLPVPFFDRSVIRDSDPGGLEALYLKQWRLGTPGGGRSGNKQAEPSNPLGVTNRSAYLYPEIQGWQLKPSDEKFRSTFLVSPGDVERIKAWISDRCRQKQMKQPPRLSPFSITCSLIWACLVRSRSEETLAAEMAEEPTYLGFNGSVMGRLDGAAPAC